MASTNLRSERASGGADLNSSRSASAQAASSTDIDPRRPVAAELLAAASGFDKQGQDPAAQLFFDQGCVDAILRALRGSDSAVERAAAVRTLGFFGSPLTTAHLIAALFDQAPEVRRAAAEGLDRLRDPAVSIGSLHAFFGANRDQQIAESAQLTDRNPTWDEAVTSECAERSRSAAQAMTTAEVCDEQALVGIDSTLSDVPPAILADLNSADPGKRAAALHEVARSSVKEGSSVITRYFGDPSPVVRNAAAQALSELEPHRTAEFFSQALETASPEQCRNIGDAMVTSGLAAKAIDDLSGEDRERARNALGILLVMAKSSAVQPLIEAIEEHESVIVRSAAMRILNLIGRPELAEAAVRRRLGI